jgi:hypothetical protein
MIEDKHLVPGIILLDHLESILYSYNGQGSLPD